MAAVDRRDTWFLATAAGLYITLLLGVPLLRAVQLASPVGLACILLDLLFLWLLFGFVRVKWRALRAPRPIPARLSATPPVTVMVPVCNEAPAVLDESFSAMAAVRWPDIRILVVENSTDPEAGEAAARLAALHRLDIVRVANRGTKAAALNDAMPEVHTDLVLFLDADVAPEPDILETLVPELTDDEELAFVQAPQRERNGHGSFVAAGARCQQAFFYEHVNEGLGAVDRALCVGSNCLLRVGPLEEVGGWPEDTVCEDVALAWAMHARGHRSRYVPRVVAWGLAPEDWRGFLRQRTRYAEGGVRLLARVVRAVADRQVRQAQLVLDYLFGFSFYLFGFAWVGFASMLILAGITRGPVHTGWMPAVLGIAFLTGQVILALDMRRRGYHYFHVLAAQGMTVLSTPAYVVGALRGMAGLRPRFRITPRTRQHAALDHVLWAGLGSAGIAGCWALLRLEAPSAKLVLGGWGLVHAAILIAPALVAHVPAFQLPIRPSKLSDRA